MNIIGREHSIQKLKPNNKEITASTSWASRYRLPPLKTKMMISTIAPVSEVKQNDEIINNYKVRMELARKAGKVNKSGFGKRKSWMNTPAHLRVARRGNKNDFAILNELHEKKARRDKIQELIKKYEDAKAGIGPQLNPGELDMYNRFKNEPPEQLLHFGRMIHNFVSPQINKDKINIIY